MQLHGVTYLVRGGAADVPAVLSLLAQEGIETTGNPDVYVRNYASFGMDEAREIVSRASGKALGGGFRIFVIAAPSFTVEAQNALLKTLEEAPGGASFFIVMPSPETLLPTVRSRTVSLSVVTMAGVGVIDPAAFCAAAPAARIDMLKAILDGDERDIAGAYALLAGVEQLLSPRIAEPRVQQGLLAVYRAREYLGDKGSLVKPLLEQAALLVPVL